jgi:hypothetical protein
MLTEKELHDVLLAVRGLSILKWTLDTSGNVSTKLLDSIHEIPMSNAPDVTDSEAVPKPNTLPTSSVSTD